ncbi:MAG: glycosyltransferase [Candidatus Marinimicrobia bacterium]|nr:glycosyltransferase [Candidatus Neomarinimicrobiota bacterium]MCF7850637.1 glycosyltransferase [Candidatus Neomarinimicrobiota bacterium]MCF7903629.1 glycosyltransferase [Candidatus Neomarinimicrobiota bacterium]
MNISVIIPTYNRANKIEIAVKSVLDQTYHPAEIIVVDDGSSDGTAAILDQFADKITVIRNSENRGVSFSRNAGISRSTGDWIAFLDSDDTWHPGKLEAQVNYHSQHPEILISQCDEIWIRNGVRVNPMVKHAKHGGWIFDKCLPLCIVSPSAVIIHRSIFQDIGSFDEQLPACEDYDLWLRIAPHYEIGLLPEKLVTRYGGHPDQLSAKYWGMDRFRIQAMEKQIDADLEPVQKKAVLEQLVFKCRVLAEGAAKRDNLEVTGIYGEKFKAYQRLLSELPPD